jgi:hypothetical protein
VIYGEHIELLLLVVLHIFLLLLMIARVQFGFFLLIDKKEVSQTLTNFLSMVERQYNKKVKIVRSDNGT